MQARSPEPVIDTTDSRPPATSRETHTHTLTHTQLNTLYHLWLKHGAKTLFAEDVNTGHVTWGLVLLSYGLKDWRWVSFSCLSGNTVKLSSLMLEVMFTTVICNFLIRYDAEYLNMQKHFRTKSHFLFCQRKQRIRNLKRHYIDVLTDIMWVNTRLVLSHWFGVEGNRLANWFIDLVIEINISSLLICAAWALPSSS